MGVKKSNLGGRGEIERNITRIILINIINTYKQIYIGIYDKNIILSQIILYALSGWQNMAGER